MLGSRLIDDQSQNGLHPYSDPGVMRAFGRVAVQPHRRSASSFRGPNAAALRCSRSSRHRADDGHWPAAGFVDTGLGLRSAFLERHGALVGKRLQSLGPSDARSRRPPSLPGRTADQPGTSAAACATACDEKMTDPSAPAPCAWNTFLARSRPMMLTSFMDALLVAVLQHPLPWHIRCRRGASTPCLRMMEFQVAPDLRYGASNTRMYVSPTPSRRVSVLLPLSAGDFAFGVSNSMNTPPSSSVDP